MADESSRDTPVYKLLAGPAFGAVAAGAVALLAEATSPLGTAVLTAFGFLLGWGLQELFRPRRTRLGLVVSSLSVLGCVLSFVLLPAIPTDSLEPQEAEPPVEQQTPSPDTEEIVPAPEPSTPSPEPEQTPERVRQLPLIPMAGASGADLVSGAVV